MSAYKTESVAKQQASKKHGKNWAENFTIIAEDDGWEIVAKLTEQPAVKNALEILGVSPADFTQGMKRAAEQGAVAGAQEEGEDLEESFSQSNGVCSTLFSAMLNPAIVPAAPATPKKAVEKVGKIIEPNRPEQNGLKRPSKGSTCCIIWDTCDKITAQKESTCTSAELFNALQGYNECTLRTQYARWRQFNGITGRLPGQNKAVKLPAAFDDAKDVLMSRVANESAQATLEAVTTAADLIQWIADNASNF